MSDSSSLSPRGSLLDNTRGSPRAERTAPAPLSFAQRRLWFLDQLAPGQPLYNMPTFVRLSGRLDAPALEQSLQRIVQRHESLRSRFVLVGREPMQEVLADWTLPLERVDLRELAPAEREPRLRELLSQEAQRPFDLMQGPLMRASLVRVGEEEHVLLLNMHHIISDGWSMGVLFSELGTLYNAARRGEQAHLPPLPFQYADFSLWQEQWMEGELLEEELSFWKQQLAGAPTRLELPTDRPRPAEQRHRGAFHRFHVPAETVRALHQLSQEEAVSPFMTLLAAFQVLLSRYSGQEDLCVGTPIANRNRPELEGIVGFFVNTLVMRTRLTGVPNFRELLGRVGEIALEAYAHQDLPFEKLVEVLQPQRDLSHAPLIQVMFSMQASSALGTGLEGLSLSPIPVDTGTSKFDLILSIEENKAGLTGDIEYDTDLFDEATVAGMATHFRVLLEGIVSDPDAPLASLPLLTPQERQRLLVEWNATSTAYPADSSIHSLFEQQVAQRPDSLALEFDSERLTYAQLEARANQLAHHLRSLGVGPDCLVGLFLDRSPSFFISMLAVLKAGGAYFPLDTSYPKERLALMIGDARPRLLLTSASLASSLPSSDVPSVVLDDLPLASLPSTPPPSSTHPLHLAYVIYTSGSTGQPKGISIPHRGVVRLVRDSAYHSFSSDERIAQLSNASFDAATFEVWGALLNGGTLVGLPRDVILSPTTLAEQLASKRVTSLFLTTALFNQVAQFAPTGFSHLRSVLFGGERVDTSSVRKVLQHGPPQRLLHVYGPTENTTYSTWHLIEHVPEDASNVPIGIPLSNSTAYVLDASLHPVPVGVPGELYVGGEGLARGYLFHPALTAERFVPHPFASSPGERLYRTGDVVRLLPSGAIEFVGRADNQVKIRGFRIEPGEVEAVLLRHPSVRECIVMAREDSPGNRRLVAYAVPHAGLSLEASELREYLQQSLPDYMVPSAFVLLEALPINPNGKVDRKALPTPDASQLTSKDYVAPRDHTEELLASLFSEMLGLPRVGIHEDFFALGGHSLLATRVTSRIREALHVELPLRALFASPSVAGLAEHVRQAKNAALPPLLPAPRHASLPLSFSQQRLWLDDQLQPGSPAYNISLALHISGALQPEVLHRSLEALTQRHESLRTSFTQLESQPVQVIAPHLELPLPLVDLSELPEPSRSQRLQELAASEARKPFDLGRAPLLRSTLLRLSASEHVLLLTMHHIVTDGWSFDVLFRELGALYAAFSSHQPPPLPALPLQYADFSVWQRQWLQGESLERQLSFWKQQLADLAPLELPTDRPRPAHRAHRGATFSFRLPAGLSSALHALCQREGVTPFMALLATFQVLLSRYSGQKDFAVGSPIAGRTRTELEGLIGFFVNTLVHRARLQPGSSFRQHLASVQASALGAFEHQDIPFEKLVEVLQPQRDPSRSPLFQVMFTLQASSSHTTTLGGLTFSTMELATGTSKFDLIFGLEDTPQGFVGGMEYDTDLFDEATVAGMATHFQVLLEGIVSNPEAPLASLPLLTPQERQRLLVEWNATSTAYPADSSIHSLFEQQASLHPDSIALEFDSERLTYAQLEARANQLAHHLRSLGVGPDCLVGLFLERSPALFVSMLAALKAGGAYFPLDTSYPKERLALMLKDAQPRLLLTSDSLASSLPSSDVTTVDLDALSLASLPSTPPPSSTHPLHLAYVIYTSGSTGQPKGISIPHRGVVRLVRDSAYHAFSSDERIAQLSNASFDAATFEVWGALLNGGTLVGLPRDVILSPVTLAEQLASKRVTSLFLTTALFNQVAQFAPTGFSHLRSVLFGGERVDTSSVRKVLQHGPPQRLLHVYGPTENTTFSTWHLTQHLAEDASNLPIGIPLSNSTAYVLDASLHPVPVGVPGELYVGGEGLARGYLFHPALTAERFIPHPFASSPGERLYRTGDVVRLLPSGAIEFVGRADTQVKIRGFRIEPGEVEAVLQRHPSVRECIVMAREDSPGNRRLVAYAVPHAGLTLEASELREYLQQSLPDYMVPSAFVLLEALPINPNGKVDRKALPAPDAADLVSNTYVAPRNPTEELLASIFAQVLGLPRVGIHEDFFALGGHSLLATRVTSRIREALHVELPLRTLFSSPSVAALARELERMRPGPSLPPLTPMPRQEPLPLSFAQQRLWLEDQMAPGGISYNMPLALHLRGRLDTAALRRTFEALLARHESLRTSFPVIEGQPTQRIHSSSEWTFPIEHLEHLPEHERMNEALRLGKEEARIPFDLSKGPLLRARLLQLAPEECVLLVTMHHIISDGWSLDVFFRELGALYAAFSSQETAPLEPLPLQYVDYALWQRQWLQGEALEQLLSFWKQQLENVPPLELPTDRPRPAVQTNRGAYLLVQLSPELSSSLRSLCQREGVTPFMALLAAFQVLLSRYSGQKDFAVGSPIAGRTRTELEGLIGFFVNTLVLRARPQPGASFRQHLASVQRSTLSAYEYQDIPFEKLVEVLQPQRDPSRSPLFQVMFALQNAPATEMQLSGLTMEPLETLGGSARFDMEVNFTDSPQGFHGNFMYNTDLFDEVTVAGMATHFQVLLEGIVSNPEAPLASLPLLTPQERQRLLVEWNATSTAYPADSSIHSLFSLQASLHPDSIALEFDSERLTYAQLEARANQLAHHLRSLGVGPDCLVGLFLERSPALFVSMLAALKAGGAYFPLDTSYPKERLALMLKDAKPGLLLTSASLASSLPSSDVPSVVLDDLSLASLPSTPPPSATHPLHLAYVIYTSGSTGQPKGISIPHRGVVRLVRDSAYHAFSSDERIAQLSNASFDAATFEVWGALLNGGTLVGLPRDVILSPVTLAEQLASKRVTSLFLTTALFNQVAQFAPTGFSHLRSVLFGGERVDTSSVRKVLQHGPPQRLLHVYGPTENTTYSTWHLIEHVPEDASNVPIGIPLSNSTAYVLDASLHPVPVGVPGELYVGGEGLARGYLFHPALTAERFVPHPFASSPGERLYRTGDVVRQLASGAIEFVGRADTQVKIRGFRIEPGEVEAVLLRHPSVRECIVMAREDSPGNRRLVAYAVPHAGLTLEASELREYLQQSLPDYMVPSAFVLLEALPINPNGKVDRKALPAPDASQLTSGDYVAPRNPTEELLASIFAQVLELPRVGIHEDFFTLGGHSLLATRVTSRIREALHVELPLRALFSSPTVAGLAEHVQQAKSASLPPLLPAPRHSPLPLSFAQHRLWLDDQLQPGSPSYNVPLAMRLSGSLDLASLESSLQELVRRHESLRTSFALHESQPVQVIAPHVELPLPLVDLSELPEPSRAQRLQELLTSEARKPFDLRRAPLLRCSLLRLSASEHVLLLTMHHIVTDGWSLDVLFRELNALYAAFSSHQPSPLPAVPLQYADFSVWQRQWLQGDALERQLSFWKQQLAGAPPLLELPTDFPRPSISSGRGAVELAHLSPAVLESLKQLSQQEGTSLFMTVLAAFQLLLGRLSGQDDICVGTSIANRTRTELEGLIGFFVNTLVLRTDLSAAPTFRELLRRVRTATLEAYAHQEVPFEQVVEAVQPRRDPRLPPLFQVKFTLQNMPSSRLSLPGLQMETLEGEWDMARYDLHLFMHEGEGALHASLLYSSDLFRSSTARRMLSHLGRLLEEVARGADAPLSSLSMLTPEEQGQLVAWNEASRLEAPAPLLHTLFEEQAAAHPEALAVRCGDKELTYRELNESANRLAHHLQEQGVGPDCPVGLCLERSVELVVALLAVLKAGGAYLPMDPGLPPERLEGMMADVGARVLLTSEKLRSEQLARHSAANPNARVLPEHLAYILFTSGSTGRPKGVGVTHANLSNYLLGIRRVLALPPGARYATVSTFAADLGNTVIFPALATGGALYVLTDAQASNPEAMADCMHTWEVDCLKIVPSHLAALLTASRPERVLPRKCLVTGGEPLRWELVERVQALAPECRMINHYGPTETTVGVLTNPLPARPTPPAERPAQTVPLGWPLANSTMYVLDAHQQLVPVGVPGELYIGGRGVTRGYVGRAELTAERFVPYLGQRVYRTGDRVRRLADGSIEFLGRADNQVKIRGYRVELGEVEAELLKQPEVRDAVVLAREDIPGTKRLVAYVVASPGHSPRAAELRQRLSRQLPEYMLPAAFVVLEALPLTRNGKVDRKALPPPPHEESAPAGEAQPLTPTQQTLAQIWKQLLRVEHVGPHDNFFALGGDSVLSIMFVARASQAGLRFSPRDLMECQTIAALAERAEASGAQVEEPLTGPVPLTPIQRRFFERYTTDRHHWNQAFLYEVRQPLPVEKLRQAVELLLLHHDTLRLRFTEGANGWEQAYAPPGSEVPVSTHDLGTLAPEAQEREMDRLATELHQSIDLSRGPLLRVALFELGPQRPAQLLVLAHHLCTDGISWRVLMEDLQTLWAQLAAGQSPTLPPKSTSYREWAQRLVEHASSESVRGELGLWLSEERARVAPLPRDFPSGLNTEGSTQVIESPVLDEEETRLLLKKVREAYGVDVDQALLAVLGRTLREWTGQDTHLVEWDNHGRESLFQDVNVSRTLGWFSALSPVVLHTPATPSHAEHLWAVRDQLRAIPHRGVGYGLLRYLSPDEQTRQRLANLPQPEVCLNYLGHLDLVDAQQGPLIPSAGPTGLPRSLSGMRARVLDIKSYVVEGRWRMLWAYSENLHQGATLHRLVEAYTRHLRALLASVRG